MVAPKVTNHVQKFYSTFKTVCNNLQIPLAADCPKFEKAFGATTEGTVLGIIFNSSNMTWRLSVTKRNNTLLLLQQVRESKNCKLLLFQRLHGKLNDFAQLCVALKSSRFQQNKFLQTFAATDAGELAIPTLLKEELMVWENCISSSGNGLPIPTIIENPPLCTLVFVSDAAGAARERRENQFFNISKPFDRGVVSVGYGKGNYFFVSMLRWPTEFLDLFPSQSLILEGIGVLLPCICMPHLLVHNNVVLYTDNEALTVAWSRRTTKHCEIGAIILQTLTRVELLLECRLFLVYQPRRSTPQAILVDNLSRLSTTTEADLQSIQHLQIMEPPAALTDWLKKPDIDWGLPQRLLKDIQLTLKKHK